jgi:hypothetical protein
MSARRPEVSEHEWRQLFRVRCASKQGQRLSDEDRELIERAHRADPKRYAAMDDDVFDATVPFGSSAKARSK